MPRGMYYKDPHTPTSRQCEWQDGDAVNKRLVESASLYVSSPWVCQSPHVSDMSSSQREAMSRWIGLTECEGNLNLLGRGSNFIIGTSDRAHIAGAMAMRDKAEPICCRAH